MYWGARQTTHAWPPVCPPWDAPNLWSCRSPSALGKPGHPARRSLEEHLSPPRAPLATHPPAPPLLSPWFFPGLPLRGVSGCTDLRLEAAVRSACLTAPVLEDPDLLQPRLVWKKDEGPSDTLTSCLLDTPLEWGMAILPCHGQVEPLTSPTPAPPASSASANSLSPFGQLRPSTSLSVASLPSRGQAFP